MALRDEILQQPEVLQSLNRESSELIRDLAREIGTPKGITIAARGTSDNAARYAKYVWGAKNRVSVALAAPSLFSIYQQPPDLRGQLVVGISQSGESPDLIAVLETASQQGAPTLAITNQPDSPLAEAADYVIDIGAGEEIAVAATKSYTAQCYTVAMLAAAWAGSTSAWDELREIPERLQGILNSESQIQTYANRYRYMEQCVVLGRGYNYATAFEWSLKLKELAYVVAQPYSSADFLHGPIALVSSGFPVFAVVPGGKVSQDLASLVKNLKDAHRAELLIISDDQELLNAADCPLALPDGIPEWLSPLVCILPAQLFSYHLTLVKGIDPDSPRGLNKVTLTR